MFILCPFTEFHPACDRGLREAGWDYTIWCVASDDFAYGRVVADHWNGVESLALVEHDIEVHADVFPQFAACDRHWCTFPYEHMTLGNYLDRGLGCVRFSAELQRAVSWLSILGSPAPVPGSWRHLDGQVAETLERNGFARHVHQPPVTHWNHHLR